ncbi:hypothetical protein ACV22V_21485 [Burkholderia sp. AW33-5]|uniref:hypothetical protein n=1 Tax=Burkholderia cepacia complex TaxID=87882 RepID=UPI000F58AF4A|nr:MULTISPECIES: hypothetical protein [Burkholderia cepacia complex]MBR8069943.1 hypothetical protein [Burkholderia cenocepacia]MBR8443917.1 hypothetical protein [Burkholderia cenocepacia]MDR8095626.1 hypothetical protein [Burkholderia cenocepacia]
MPSVQEMIARRRMIAKEIGRLQEEMQHLDNAICGAFEQVATMFSPGATTSWPVHIEHAPSNPYRRRVGPTEEVEAPTGDRRRLVPAVLQLLEAHRGPIKTRDILDYLKMSGIEVGGKNEMNNLSAHLSSTEMVESTPEGWVLRGRGR